MGLPGSFELGYVAAVELEVLRVRECALDMSGEADGHDVTGPIMVPRTGSWQSFTTVSRTGIRFYAGPHMLKLVMDANGPSGLVGNFNWMNWVVTNTARARRRRS